MSISERYRSQDLLLKQVGDFSKNFLVITFDSYSDNPTLDRPGFGEDFFYRNQIDAVHVISRINDWYQQRDMDVVLEQIEKIAKDYEKVFTYGSSMGGYAALRHARRFNAVAIALAPQYSLDPDVVPWENRWVEAKTISFSIEEKSKIEAFSKAYVFYDPRVVFDRRHITLISQDAVIEHVTIPYAGHVVGVYLSQLSMLGRGIFDILHDRFDLAQFIKEARQRKREAAKYFEEMSGLARKRHTDWAISLGLKAARLSPTDAGVANNLFWLFREKDDVEQAEHWAREAGRHDPANLLYQKNLASLLLQIGKPLEAHEIFLGLIKFFPREADYYHSLAMCCGLMDQLDKAIEFEEQAVALAPKKTVYRKDLQNFLKERSVRSQGGQTHLRKNAFFLRFLRKYLEAISRGLGGFFKTCFK